MLVQFGNNWIQKIPLTAKLDSACGLVQFWLSSEFFSSNYFQIGQYVVLLHILIKNRPWLFKGWILLSNGSISIQWIVQLVFQLLIRCIVIYDSVE